MVWVMDDWRCRTGRRASKKSRGGDCRWEVSTGMLMLRRNPCLFTGCTAPGQSGQRQECDKNEWFTGERGGFAERDGSPGRKWEARRATSVSWECPVGAREASSSAGCWCSPAVVQPCSLSHPGPASCKDGARGGVIITEPELNVRKKTFWYFRHFVFLTPYSKETVKVTFSVHCISIRHTYTVHCIVYCILFTPHTKYFAQPTEEGNKYLCHIVRKFAVLKAVLNTTAKPKRDPHLWLKVSQLHTGINPALMTQYVFPWQSLSGL